MDSETTQLVLANRSFIYSLLARGFAVEPDAVFLDILRQGHTRQELALAAHPLTESIEMAYNRVLDALDTGEGTDRVRHEYVEAFVGPGTLKAYPWETVHLSDTRTLFQPELLSIRESYREAGFLPARYPHVQDDFVGLELDFLAKLAGTALNAWEAGDKARVEECLAHSRRFLDEHLLVWIDSLAAALEREYGDCFYARFTTLAAHLVHRDRDILS